MNLPRTSVDRNGIVQEPTMQEYLETLLRGKWIVLSCFLVGAIGSAILAFSIAPTYEATAVVLIDTQKPLSSFPLMDLTGFGSGKSVENELEVLKSNSLAESVAHRLIAHAVEGYPGLDSILIILPESNEEAGDIATIPEIVERLKDCVKFSNVRQTDVIAIVARSTSAPEATLITNTFAESYYDRNVNSSRIRSHAVREFLDQQLKLRKNWLDNAESSLQSYMEKHGIVLLDEEAKGIIEQLSRLEAERDEAEVNIQSHRKTLASYQNELTTLEPNVALAIGGADNSYIRSLQEELAKLEVKRDVTIAQNPTLVGQQVYHQTIKEANEQIDELRGKLKQRTDLYVRSLVPGQASLSGTTDPAGFVMGLKQKIVELQIQLLGLEARKKALSQVIAQCEKQFEIIPEKWMRYAQLERSRLSAEKLFLLVEEKYNEAAITEQSEFGYVDIMDPAVIPEKPVSPKKILWVLAGMFLGFAFGAGIVCLREYIDVRIRTPDDLVKRGVTLLNTVALMDEEIRKLGGKTRVEQEGVLVDAHLLACVNPLSQIAESYRKLRTNIQYAQIDTPLHTILVTSANPSEGKSTTASNLAITFAQMGKKVVLLDTDLRKPTLDAEFSVAKRPGITELLSGTASLDEVLRTLKVPNLDLICCGTIPPNPSETLASNGMRSLVEELRKRFDILIFDSPPVLAVTDPIVLSTMVDGVIVVTSSGSTRVEALDRTLDSLSGVGAHTLGVVLNNFDIRKAYGSYYGSDKYALYGYGNGYGRNDSGNGHNGNGNGNGNGHSEGRFAHLFSGWKGDKGGKS